MKVTYIVIIFLISFSRSYTNTDEIKKTFNEFQSAILDNNCDKLVAISDFPIESELGLARLLNIDLSTNDIKKYGYQISYELLINRCAILDSIELEVLSQYTVDDESNNQGVAYNGCIYKAYMFIPEDYSYFKWSVGCTEVFEEEIGEYALIFYFELIDDKYKLKHIIGAG